MINRFSSVFLILTCLLFAAGCSEEKSSEPGVVSYVSGAEQLKAYQRTKVKVEDIDNKLEERYQDIE